MTRGKNAQILKFLIMKETPRSKSACGVLLPGASWWNGLFPSGKITA